MRVISCEITHIKEIPESGYFVCDYGDAVTLERNPPTREYLGWEFYNIVGLYYNEKYIIGFKCFFCYNFMRNINVVTC